MIFIIRRSALSNYNRVILIINLISWVIEIIEELAKARINIVKKSAGIHPEIKLISEKLLRK